MRFIAGLPIAGIIVVFSVFSGAGLPGLLERKRSRLPQGGSSNSALMPALFVANEYGEMLPVSRSHCWALFAADWMLPEAGASMLVFVRKRISPSLSLRRWWRRIASRPGSGRTARPSLE